MISKYIVLHEGDKCLMVLRPYQFYAVEEILDKVQNSTDNASFGTLRELARLLLLLRRHNSFRSWMAWIR